MDINKIVKGLLPPILFSLLKSVYKLFRRHKYYPKWYTISGGLIQGYRIYTSSGIDICREMINGSYDAFCWEYLQGVDLFTKTVIDVGAHVGYCSMCFSKLVGRYGNVYTFEPNIYNVKRMQMNLKKNKEMVSNIWLEPVVVSSYVGGSKFYFSSNVDDQTSRGGYVEGSHKPLPEEVYKRANYVSKRINVVTLDHFIKKRNVKDIRLIKVDVEGAESSVIKGARSVIRDFSPILLIEIHSVISMFEITKEMQILNYELRILQEDSSNRCFVVATKA